MLLSTPSISLQQAEKEAAPVPSPLTSDEIRILSINYAPATTNLTDPGLDAEPLRMAADTLYKAMCKCEPYLAYRMPQTRQKKQPKIQVHRDENGEAVEDNIQVWPETFERSFLRAALACPPIGRRKLMFNGKPMGRNDIMAVYISRWMNSTRDRKQVSSHLQTLKAMFGTTGLIAKILFSKSTTPDRVIPSIGSGPFIEQHYPAFQAIYGNPSMMDMSSITTGAINHSNARQSSTASVFCSPSSSIPQNVNYGTSSSRTSTMPSIFPTHFGIYITSPNHLHSNSVRHTFTSLASAPQQKDISVTTFKRSRCCAVDSTRSPTILVTSSINAALANKELAQGANLTITLEMSASNLGPTDGLYSTTSFVDTGVKEPIIRETLNFSPVTQNLVGFTFGTEFWSRVLGALAERPVHALRRLSSISGTQQIWCHNQLLLTLCWQFKASDEPKTTWAYVNPERPASSTANNGVSSLGVDFMNPASSFGMPSINAGTSFGITSMDDMSSLTSNPSTSTYPSMTGLDMSSMMGGGGNGTLPTYYTSHMLHVAAGAQTTDDVMDSLGSFFNTLGVNGSTMASGTSSSGSSAYLGSPLNPMSNDVGLGFAVPSYVTTTPTKTVKKGSTRGSTTTFKRGSKVSTARSQRSATSSSKNSVMSPGVGSLLSNMNMGAPYLDSTLYKPITGYDAYPPANLGDMPTTTGQVIPLSSASIFDDMAMGTVSPPVHMSAFLTRAAFGNNQPASIPGNVDWNSLY